MKKIKNEKFKFSQKEKKDSTTADLAKLCLNNPPKGGFTKDDIKMRDRIEQRIDASKTKAFIELEDHDFEYLSETVDSMVWAFRHPQISKFINQIEVAK